MLFIAAQQIAPTLVLKTNISLCFCGSEIQEQLI